jgi:hypothetical protein
MPSCASNACVEEIDYRTVRGLDKNAIRALLQEWLGPQKHENVVLGPAGVGNRASAKVVPQWLLGAG